MRRNFFTFLSIWIILSSLLHAEVPTKESVTKLYVATFNRAPDQAGLVYWSTHADFKTIEPIAESFFYQEETQLLYPNTMDNSEFVNEIYNNLFNRDAEPAGFSLLG